MKTPKHTPTPRLVNQLAAAYTKAFCHNPSDVIYNNMERCLLDCPEIVRAVNAHDELVSACATAAEDIRQFLAGEWDGSIEGWQETRERLLKALAKARGES